MTEFTWGKGEPDEGTMLQIGLRYQGSPKTWTYTALMAGGYWYLSGTGRTPQAAGWGAVARWAASEGRSVVFIRVVTETAVLWHEDPREWCRANGPHDMGHHIETCPDAAAPADRDLT